MKRKEQKSEEKSIGTRYPLDVLSDMKQLAKDHGRSFNGEVVWALREYIKQQKGEQKHGDHKKDQA